MKKLSYLKWHMMGLLSCLSKGNTYQQIVCSLYLSINTWIPNYLPKLSAMYIHCQLPVRRCVQLTYNIIGELPIPNIFILIINYCYNFNEFLSRRIKHYYRQFVVCWDYMSFAGLRFYEWAEIILAIEKRYFVTAFHHHCELI